MDTLAFVCDAERGATALGDRAPLRVGDLADDGSVSAALDGVDAVLLCSPHGPVADPNRVSGRLGQKAPSPSPVRYRDR